MQATLEQIEMLRERANVSYSEAKEVLEKCGGDVLEALIYLEGQSKVRKAAPAGGACGAGKTCKGLMKTLGDLIKKGNITKFVIKKGDYQLVDLPVNLVLIITIAMPPLTVVGLLAALLTNHKIRFVKPDGGDMEINKTFDKLSEAVSSVSSEAGNKTENSN